jgi:hypothetical protein
MENLLSSSGFVTAIRDEQWGKFVPMVHRFVQAFDGFA